MVINFFVNLCIKSFNMTLYYFVRLTVSVEKSLSDAGCLGLISKVISSVLTDYNELSASNFAKNNFEKLKKRSLQKYDAFGNPYLADVWDWRMFLVANLIREERDYSFEFLVDAIGIRTTGKYFPEFIQLWNQMHSAYPEDTGGKDLDALISENQKLKQEKEKLLDHYFAMGDKLNTTVVQLNSLKSQMQSRPPITNEALDQLLSSIQSLPLYEYKDIFLHTLKDLDIYSSEQSSQINQTLELIKKQHMPQAPSVNINQQIDNSNIVFGTVKNDYTH